MNLRRMIKKLYYLQSTILICLISGCNIESGLIHYLPPEDSVISIEFDYPEEWEWVSEREVSVMRAYDPQYPLEDLDDTTNFPYFGMIVLHVQNNAKPEIMGEYAQSYIDATQFIGGEMLVDKKIEIDGTLAGWLERRVPANPDISRDYEVFYISIFCYENGDFYTMHLSVPFEERDGEFARGFQRMISSIEFIP